MKKISFIAVITALISTFTLSSCLNNDNYEPYDAYAYVTVKTDANGSTYLAGDIDNIKYYPISSTVLSPLKQTDGKYYERAIVSIKFADGQIAPKKGEKCNIKEISVNNALLIQDMTTEPDTLSGDYSFISIAPQDNFGMIWAGNGFINVPFKYYLNRNDKLYNFQLYITEAKEDTLYTRLRRTSETNLSSTTSSALISFRIPKDFETIEKMQELVPQENDSIVIKVSALDKDSKEISKSTKVYFDDLY